MTIYLFKNKFQKKLFKFGLNLKNFKRKKEKNNFSFIFPAKKKL